MFPESLAFSWPVCPVLSHPLAPLHLLDFYYAPLYYLLTHTVWYQNLVEITLSLIHLLLLWSLSQPIRHESWGTVTEQTETHNTQPSTLTFIHFGQFRFTVHLLFIHLWEYSILRNPIVAQGWLS